jgi:hypothetical protein
VPTWPGACWTGCAEPIRDRQPASRAGNGLGPRFTNNRDANRAAGKAGPPVVQSGYEPRWHPLPATCRSGLVGHDDRVPRRGTGTRTRTRRRMLSRYARVIPACSRTQWAAADSL